MRAGRGDNNLKRVDWKGGRVGFWQYFYYPAEQILVKKSTTILIGSLKSLEKNKLFWMSGPEHWTSIGVIYHCWKKISYFGSYTITRYIGNVSHRIEEIENDKIWQFLHFLIKLIIRHEYLMLVQFLLKIKLTHSNRRRRMHWCEITTSL